MCVIIHALKKKKLARKEVVDAMRHNSSGFFMAHWPQDCKSPDGRKTIRTMRENEALNFFDSTPDDNVFVMHARIPSRGATSLDNVHGWEEDGVLFCHNMTMSSLNDVMSAEGWKGTDSEYFFRKLFMPMHRGEHMADPNLKPGEMGADSRRLTTLLCGSTNKMLFVMPDNTVLKAGKWETIASEKATVQEEREVDEVIGEHIGVDGKIEKKTQKVKRMIDVEREFSVVVASNTYYRNASQSSLTSYAYNSASNWGNMRWNSTTKCYEKVNEKPASSASQGTSAGTTYHDWDDYYDGEYYDYYGHGTEKKKPAAKKASAAKLEADEDDMTKFLKWRESNKDYQLSKGVMKDPKSVAKDSILFEGVKYEKGMFDGASLAMLFNIMLRAIVYHNMESNMSCIANVMNATEASGRNFDGFVAESSALVSSVIPELFDEDTYGQVIDLVECIGYKLSELDDVDGVVDMVLPSELVADSFAQLMEQIDAKRCMQLADEAAAGGSSEITDANYAQEFKTMMEASDLRLNVSFDPTVKGNKNVEKYVRAGLVVNRKLSWINPAILLAGCGSHVNQKGEWNEGKYQKMYLDALNFLAEACTTNGTSLVSADRKYVAHVKEVFNGFSSPETVKQEPETVKQKSEAVKQDDEIVHVLGDPEKAEKSGKSETDNSAVKTNAAQKTAEKEGVHA